MESDLIGEISGLSCGAAWAVISLIMRSVANRVSPVVVNGLRCLFAAITLGIVVLVFGRGDGVLALFKGSVLAIVASGILGQAVGDALFLRSAKLIGASRALPISSVSPLLTLALAILLLGEQVAPFGVVGTILVLGGVFLLAFPYGALPMPREILRTADRSGLLQALAAACCYALSTVVLKRGLEGTDLVAANFVRMTTAALLLVGLEGVHAREKVLVGLSRRGLAVMVVTGIMSAFSSSMYVTSVQFAGAAKASILTSTSPLFGLPLSLIFLKEKVGRRVVAGTLLSVLGIWLVLWR
ncbi:MAG: DMT family transporter [Chloroflexota bacterium]